MKPDRCPNCKSGFVHRIRRQIEPMGVEEYGCIECGKTWTVERKRAA